MFQSITILRDDICQQLKLSYEIPSVIKQIVTRKIVASVAEELDIKVEAAELQQAADNFRLINKLKSADETWSWLQRHSLSLDEFEDSVYTQLLSVKLARHLFADKVEQFFIEHQLDYTGVVMYEIILDDEDLAIELFYTIQEEEVSFPEVAYQYIQDTELRRCGGYRGMVYRTQLRPEISAAVFTAKPRQLLKPVVTSKGVHLILVEELIQPQLDEKLRAQILSSLFFKWLQQQIERVEVAIDLDYGRQAASI